jgi:hypothetical protein
MKAKEFDKKFDKGKDISKHLDVSKALKPGRKQKSGNIGHQRKVHPTQEERQRMTLEALSDVDAGRVIDHEAVEKWAESLSTKKPQLNIKRKICA